MKKIYILFFLSFFLFSCRSQIEFHKPLPLDTSFKTQKPDAHNLLHCQKTAEYSKKHNGKALLIIQGKNIIFEEYQNGYTPETPHHIFSGTKSFAGILAVCAVADGIINLDEKVSDTIQEFKSDPLKSKLTIRQLLHFTSGIKQSFFWLTYDGMMKNQWLDNKYAYALKLDFNQEPGKKFKYGSSHLAVFGELMKRKLGKSPLLYLQERIFTPINFRYAGWHHDPAGNPMFSYGAWTTAREWAKFGILVRDNGRWENKQLIPAKLVKECFKGSKAMPAYGLNFWLINETMPEDVLKDLPASMQKKFRKYQANKAINDPIIVAAGYNDNRLYIIPSLDMIIVRLALTHKGFSDHKILGLLLTHKENKEIKP